MKSSPFPKAIEVCLKGMVYSVRDPSFVVGFHCTFVWSVCGERIKVSEILKYGISSSNQRTGHSLRK